MAAQPTAPRKQLGLLPSEWPEPDELNEPKSNPAMDLFASQCRAYRLPPVTCELKFAKKAIGRLWMFDFAFESLWVAVEIEGLVVAPRCRKCHPRELVVVGRHASIKGINEDMVKYNSAAMLGWTVLRFPPKDIKPKHAIEMTMRVLAARGWKGAGEPPVQASAPDNNQVKTDVQ